jgi:hypothetical protein
MKKRGAFDVQHPFFRPLWRRVAITAFTGLWALFELWHGNTFWAALFGAITLYLAHQLFYAFNPRPDPPEDERPPR